MYNEIIEKALAKKGQFATVNYERKAKTLKNAPEILKQTKAFNVRIGAEYDALKSTLEAKGVDTKAEAHALNNGLNGMEYIVYPVLLKGKNDRQYIRLETAKNTRFETTYFINGKPVKKSEIAQYLQASEKKPSGDLPPVMNIGIDNITEIK